MASPLGFSHLDPVTLQVIIKETDALSSGKDKKTPRQRDKSQKSQVVSIDVEQLKQPDEVQKVQEVRELPKKQLPIQEIHSLFEKHGFHMKEGKELDEILTIDAPVGDKIMYLLEPPSLPISSRLALSKKMKELDAKKKELEDIQKEIDSIHPPLEQEDLFHCMTSLSATNCDKQHPNVKQILLSMSYVVPHLFNDAMKIAISQKKPVSQHKNADSQHKNADSQQDAPKSSDVSPIEFQVNKMDKSPIPTNKYVKTTMEHAKELLTKFPNVVIAQYLMWSRQNGYVRADKGEFAVLTHKNDATHFVNALNVHFGDTSEGVDVGLFTPEAIQRFFGLATK
jgi:hypothetical protein